MSVCRFVLRVMEEIDLPVHVRQHREGLLVRCMVIEGIGIRIVEDQIVIDF